MGVTHEPQVVLSGAEAVVRVERTITASAPAGAAAVAEGLALAGAPAASWLDGFVAEPTGAVALRGASCVHHVRAEPGEARAGVFELAAASAQQAADHCLVGHLLSQRVGRPGLCSLAASVADELGLVSLPDSERLLELLREESGPGQPEADPAAIGEAAREALRAAGELTGRPASAIEVQGAGKAEIALVAAGDQLAPARAAASALSAAGVPARAIGVVLLRPFPEPEVREALTGVRVVVVLHRPGGSGALLAAVRAAADEKAEVRAEPAADAASVVQRVAALLPGKRLERPEPSPANPGGTARRLAVVPAGPWGEATARQTLAAFGRLGSLDLEPGGRPERGTSWIGWDCAGLPASDSDLLLASHPAFLDAGGALALARPGSSVVVLSGADSSAELVAQLAPGARDLLREHELELHWVRPPAAGEEPAAGEAAGLLLAGAALAVASGSEDEASAALGTGEADPQARWLRLGAQAVAGVATDELEPLPSSEEVDFRPTPTLPHMPEAVDDAKAKERWLPWVQHFHRTGAGSLDTSPGLPVRPALLDQLARELHRAMPHPFVVVPSEDPERPVHARSLRELLDDTIAGVAAAGRDVRALSENLDSLVAIAARGLGEPDAGAELDGLVAAAGGELARALDLPADEESALKAALVELRERLPAQSLVLGPGRETPLQLYTRVVEAVRGPLRRRFDERLHGLREQLADLLRIHHMASPDGRKPEALAAELGVASTTFLDPEALSRTLPGTPAASGVLKSPRRRRIEAVLDVIDAHLAKPDRWPGVFVLRPPGLDLALAAEQQREHPDPLAAAVGYFDGTARRLAPLFRAARVAQLEVESRYLPERHDAPLADLDWEAFTAQELALVPPVAVLTTGRRLRQRGQGSLSELLSSSRPVHVIVRDELGAADEAGDPSRYHIDLGYLVMAHREAFAVGSTLARPDRLTEGLVRMARAPRPGVVLVSQPAEPLAPWRALLAEAALRGRVSPEFLYDPDAGVSWADRFDLEGNPQPDRAWPLETLQMLEGGEERTLEVAFTFADAVALEPAYLRHLRAVPRAAWDDDQVPLAEYLERFDVEGRERIIPYLWVIDDTGGLGRAVVTRELAMACRDRLRGWRVLQELAGYENAYAENAAAAARERALAEAAEERGELERAHAEALQGARGEGAREAMERLAAALMSPEGVAAALPSPAPSVVAPAETAPEEAAAEPAPEEAVAEEEEALAFDEPYIDGPLCTTCNECTNINGRLFQYNADKQAYIADAAAGTFAELVKAAKLCPARCIHPGVPRSGDSTATPELIEQAAEFN